MAERFGGARDLANTSPPPSIAARKAHQPKMMSISLHLRIIGRPSRIGALDRILRHIATKQTPGLHPRRHRPSLADPLSGEPLIICSGWINNFPAVAIPVPQRIIASWRNGSAASPRGMGAEYSAGILEPFPVLGDESKPLGIPNATRRC